MANDDKTEKPTGKRRGEARKKGQVAKSTDLTGVAVMVAGLIAVSLMAGKVVASVASVMVKVFAQISHPGSVATAAGLGALMHEGAMTLLKAVGPIFGICIAAAVLANVAQIGLRPTAQALKPNFGRLNPVNGIKRLFGPKIAFEAAKAIAKVSMLGGIVALALIPDITHLAANVGTTPLALGHLMKAGVTGIAERAAIGYLLIGVIDYAIQKRRHEKSLKMTKQEVKDEGKQHQLPPEVRGAIRRRQIQQARARMMAAIPQADVVVTNPTHFAVALEYTNERAAPVVVAKGADHVALQIRRIAEENDIPIIEDAPLARELYRVVELDQMIPAELYQAVAQVLAFVYRLAARRRVSV
jgi:flagellar biosynthetic protein FlhB